jgi:hypothetical protein
MVFLFTFCVTKTYSTQNDTISYFGYFSSQATNLLSVSYDLHLDFIKSSSKIGGCYSFNIENRYSNKTIDYVLFLNEFCYFKPSSDCKYQVKLKKLNTNVYQLIYCDSFDYISGRKHLMEERKQVIDSLEKKIFSLNNLVFTDKPDYYYVPYLINLLNDSINYFCLEEISYFVDPGGPVYNLNCYPINKMAFRELEYFFCYYNYPKTISKTDWMNWYKEKIKPERE